MRQASRSSQRLEKHCYFRVLRKGLFVMLTVEHSLMCQSGRELPEERRESAKIGEDVSSSVTGVEWQV